MENKNSRKNICDHKECMPTLAFLAGTFLIVLIVFFAVSISNKIKEGKYIGQDIQSKNTISVTATGDIFAKPDLTLVSFFVVNEDKTVIGAMSENAKRMNAVIDFIKKQGVTDKDIKTTAFNISPRYEWRKDGEQRILVGYEVSQSLEVKIRDLSKIGTIIEGAAANGANQIGSLQFTIDNQDELKKQARQKAINDAKTKAQELAFQLGVKIGNIVNFSESGVWPTPIYYGLEKAVAVGGGDIPQIETGENKISVSVIITYEIR